MNTSSTSLASVPSLVRRPSPSSRPSYAPSFVEQGDGAAAEDAPAETAEIEEEIAEIKRYEVNTNAALPESWGRLSSSGAAWRTDLSIRTFLR
jgi:hypothetical protein